MEKVIYKYCLMQHINKIAMPAGARILKAGVDGNGIDCIWAIVDKTEDIMEEHYIVKLGTGWEFDENQIKQYIDTIVEKDGLVWHIFELKEFKI